MPARVDYDLHGRTYAQHRRADALLEAGVEQRIVARLARALSTGAWDAAHGHLREQREFDGALRLVVSLAK